MSMFRASMSSILDDRLSASPLLGLSDHCLISGGVYISMHPRARACSMYHTTRCFEIGIPSLCSPCLVGPAMYL